MCICRAAEATSAQLKEMAPSQQQQHHSSKVDLVTKEIRGNKKHVTKN